jgi:hypothetical protein
MRGFNVAWIGIALIAAVSSVLTGQAAAHDAPVRKTGKKAPSAVVREQQPQRSSADESVRARANANDPANNYSGLPDWARAAMPSPGRR